MIKISPSILSAKDRLTCVKHLNNTSADYLHLDIMDNKFVPNFQLPINEVNILAKHSNLPLDIHLMVEDPKEYIENIKSDNINNITFHIEINKDIYELINLIITKNCKVGIAINPNTDIDSLDNYINIVDTILVMSVEPGFGGQKFIDNTVERIKKIKAKRKDITIEVDGGINKETINKIKNIADIAVSGSYIVNSNNYEEAINNLKN